MGDHTSSGSVVVVGCGLMGCDIAAIFLASGRPVEAVARDTSRWPERQARIAKSLVQLGAGPQDARFHTDLDTVPWDGAALVIETVPEDFGLKASVFAELDRLVPPDVPVVTNTSGFRITEIAEGLVTASRMAGLHFFLPAHLVPAVEVVRGERTDDATMDAVAAMVAAADRVPVRVAQDKPGFLANRIQHALMREVFAVLDEGVATPEDVDAAVRFAFGFRYVAAGPLMQKEMAGLDTQRAAAAAIYPTLASNTEPARVLSDLVATGRLGLKSGHGFWQWTPEKAASVRERYEATLLAVLSLMTRDETSLGREGGP